MSLKATSFALLTSVLTLSFLALAYAQTPATPQGPAPQAYRPGLGDLMTMTVQPRHIKLGLAGREKNWSFAAYELHELEESFERIVRVWPMYRKTNIAELMVATTKEPMEAVSQAIKSADAARFDEAYARLTATCNACHQSTERAFVVIQVPQTSPFPDQDFRPVKP
ncbi:hypothetical protein SAMN02990966_02803 [Rhodospirillales bacterium URHD0017]|nr:hypothetical protein SAMN02990966_02803 [Rhodospirillales bacterium URHD0017]